MRLAYADPPYPGQAWRHYGGEEVDHGELVDRLAKYDGWALSTSARALRDVLALCPAYVRVAAWVKPIAPPMGDGFVYGWEPVIFAPARRPRLHVRDTLTCSPPQFTFRPRPAGHVIGEKPVEFCDWLFGLLAASPGDCLDDLFPGSGAVGRAWEAFAAQTRIFA